MGGQRHAPAALPPGKTRYSLYRRLGRPQGRSGRVWKISPPPEFGPLTVQPLASHYTDWAIPAHIPSWGSAQISVAMSPCLLNSLRRHVILRDLHIELAPCHLLVPRGLRSFLEFWKISGPLHYSIENWVTATFSISLIINYPASRRYVICRTDSIVKHAENEYKMEEWCLRTPRSSLRVSQ